MLSLRLHWYALETSRVLRRHWQVLCLTIMLVLPSMPVFAQARILGAPVLATLAPARGAEWQFLWVHALEAVGVLWVLAQRRAISGGSFATFVRSLPVPAWRQRGVDAAVVALASTPLLLSVAAALVALALTPENGIPSFYVLDLTLITLGAQLAVLNRSLRNAVPLVMANALLVAGLQTSGSLAFSMLAGALGVSVWTLIRVPAVPAPRQWRLGSLHTIAPTAGLRRLLSPSGWVQIGILRSHASTVAGRGALMAATAAATCYLSALWAFDIRAKALVLMAQAVILVIAAMHFRELSQAHYRAAHFTRSLPCRPIWQTLADIATVLGVALVFVVIGPVFLAINGAMPLWQTPPLLLAGIPLVALLRLPQRFAPRQSVLLGATLAALWVATVWPCFVY
ncbi:hypothetical protein PHO31112_00549 [Pandoraea horticolens]|uniref:Uncharacterized protein n=1 Tax=Pandoraea horticolens TaxID=2508298 RepID=A0A5E4S745_9BURK|nr:hypothetical protein [Pandoraea horticolens]VVD69889.1 hypothetical protein PHO31112_00549 [Pandoraea horticolens]